MKQIIVMALVFSVALGFGGTASRADIKSFEEQAGWVNTFNSMKSDQRNAEHNVVRYTQVLNDLAASLEDLTDAEIGLLTIVELDTMLGVVRTALEVADSMLRTGSIGNGKYERQSYFALEAARNRLRAQEIRLELERATRK